ncbi:RNA polymerase sigma factor [Neolewinella lacunae]|uniref:RNA polymerase sigma factor n=1 Tax=Neolewinella lacunae TaxID=1517758 RepID=A0A923T810_9BACT|nr:RNA polymerase sigma factor [Neolewinella lacunae]MBC6994089.1 RNA polymerase sigma factor [Neolewinella lacunae]MDN3636762.1 RNA polymerase sigma factor [Neolewinella lacunae]
MNPFKSTYSSDQTDQELIQQVLEGNKNALTQLVERHQPFLYNTAWKMTGSIADAEDLTQETWIKIISNLSRFKQESTFQTWAYRIAKNHFLNSKTKASSVFANNFEELGARLDAAPNTDLSESEQMEQRETIREVRLNCLSGMLLCLTKEQRLIYIIGEIFSADHTIGSEIMEISKANYRMKLSKARKDLYNFMQNKCGLVNKANPCRCHKKVTFATANGMVDAKNLLYNRKEYSTFKEQLGDDANFLVDDSELKYASLHHDHSFKTQFEKKNFLVQLLDDENWKSRLNLN